jgi:hypothetical protein
MGVSISMKKGGQWISITPGWRSQMATWLREVGGDHDPMCFTEADVPALEERKQNQRKGVEHPPFDQSDEWVACFDTIISQIRQSGEALVRLSW